MRLIKFLKNIFKNPSTNKSNNQYSNNNLKKIKDLDLFDTVWIRENDCLFEGWILDITRRSIIVCYCNDLTDFKFRTEGHSNDTFIEQDNKILYCNKQ